MKSLFHFIAPLAYASLIAIASSLNSVPGFVSKYDKFYHLLSYIPLGFLCVRSFQKLSFKKTYLSFALGFSLSALYGVLDEYHQSFVPGRLFSLGDMVADTIGSFLGAVSFVVYFSYLNKFRQESLYET